MAAHHRIHDRRAAVERHMREIELVGRLQQLAREMPGLPHARRGEVVLAGIGLMNATSSLTVFAGTDGCTISTFGADAATVIGAKSLIAS